MIKKIKKNQTPENLMRIDRRSVKTSHDDPLPKSVRDFGVESGSWGVLTKRQRELVREEGGGEERSYILFSLPSAKSILADT